MHCILKSVLQLILYFLILLPLLTKHSDIYSCIITKFVLLFIFNSGKSHFFITYSHTSWLLLLFVGLIVRFFHSTHFESVHLFSFLFSYNSCLLFNLTRYTEIIFSKTVFHYHVF